MLPQHRDGWPRAQKKSKITKTHIFIGIGVVIVIMWFLLVSNTPSPSSSLQDVNVDMHLHTTESDGDRTAEEQITIARNLGLHSIWITDHDMIRDIPRIREIQKVANEKKVHVSFGVEITVGWLKKEHHLLGYFPDSSWQSDSLSVAMKVLQAACAEVKDSRENRNQAMVSFLNELLSSDLGKDYFVNPADQAKFKPLKVAEVASWAQKNANLMEPTSLGRPHFRQYLITILGVDERLIFGPRAGDGVAIKTADGQVYFDDDREGKTGVKLEALMHSATLEKKGIAFKPLPIDEAIELINGAGGRAVLAHPPTLGSSWVEKFGPHIGDLKAAGLWGIEAFSSEINSENHQIIHDYADQYGLEMTGGSDNHGSLKIYAKLGDVHRADSEVYKELSIWAQTGLHQSQRLGNEL